MGERGTPLLEALPAGQPLWRAKGKKKPQGSKRDRCQGHRKWVEATGEQCVGDRQSEKDGGGGGGVLTWGQSQGLRNLGSFSHALLAAQGQPINRESGPALPKLSSCCVLLFTQMQTDDHRS